ncbi:MAG: tyrosine-type recombinase/integrase, partial [Dehalococcoidia bacterium]
KEALKWAVRWELINRNPADSVDAPVATTKRARTSTLDELTRILDAADKRSDSVLVRLTLHTGMRLGEVLGLRWSDLDLDKRVVTIEQTFGADGQFRKPKTESSRRSISLDADIVVRRSLDVLLCRETQTGGGSDWMNRCRQAQREV